LGDRGLIWYDETGAIHSDRALAVPRERVVDTNGAGDVFHGAYIYSYLADPTRRWAEHFGFAQAAAAHKIQRLGNEAGLPTLDDVRAVQRELAAEMANSE
jgi:sugar/nucleoside kinase (ribokinase family)